MYDNMEREIERKRKLAYKRFHISNHQLHLRVDNQPIELYIIINWEWNKIYQLLNFPFSFSLGEREKKKEH